MNLVAASQSQKSKISRDAIILFEKPFGFGGSQSTGTAKTATPSPLFERLRICTRVKSYYSPSAPPVPCSHSPTPHHHPLGEPSPRGSAAPSKVPSVVTAIALTLPQGGVSLILCPRRRKSCRVRASKLQDSERN